MKIKIKMMQNTNQKFDWKQLLRNVIKVAIGALMGWLGGGAI